MKPLSDDEVDRRRRQPGHPPHSSDLAGACVRRLMERIFNGPDRTEPADPRGARD
jgi:hypothetical protein